MKVLVCGGRNFMNWYQMVTVLNSIHDKNKITKIINGNAYGADQMSTEWAKRKNVEYAVYPAQWDKYGSPRAGMIRNRKMLEAKPDLVVAFRGGRGTANMVKIAREAGIKVRIIYK